MKLMTKEVAETLPALGAQDGKGLDAIVHAKFFDSCGRGTWYVLEYDGGDVLFTFCRSPLGPDCDEYGYASLAELQGVRNRLGLGIERDLNWQPTPIGRVLQGLAP